MSDLIREGLDEGDVVLHRLQGDGAVLHVGELNKQIFNLERSGKGCNAALAKKSEKILRKKINKIV